MKDERGVEGGLGEGEGGYIWWTVATAARTCSNCYKKTLGEGFVGRTSCVTEVRLRAGGGGDVVEVSVVVAMMLMM